jgi:hypothetical protein
MMTENEIKRIVAAAVEETLIKIGIDPDDLIEVQKDMSFVRDWRLSTSAVKRHGILVAVGVVVMASLGLIWLAIKGGTP